MAATTTDLTTTEAPAAPASATAAAPLSGGLATASTLSAVLGIFLPLFGIIAASVVARRARDNGFSARFPDLVMFWAAILMYVETLWLFTQLLGLLGHH